MGTEISPSQAIAKAISASQLVCLPFTCSLTSLVVIFTWRYISKTSPRRISTLGYFEYPCGSRRPSQVVLARASMGLVASLCIIMTFLELWHSYQANVSEHQNLSYFQRTPWTFALVPILTVIVNCTSQIYFSKKVCKDRLTQRLLSLLGILGILSLLGGLCSTIAMIVRLAGGSQSHGTSATEKLFWMYLISTTLSSFLISYHLVGIHFKERRVMLQSEASRKLTTYALVFILQLSCFLSACASLSTNFTVALQASQALFFLQRLTICFMAISLVCLLREENEIKEVKKTAQQIQFHQVRDVGNTDEKKCEEETTPHRPRRPSEVDVRDVGRFDLTTYNHPVNQSLSSEEDDEIEDIFADSFPSEVIVVTEDYPVKNSVWPSTTIIPALLSRPEKAVGEFTALPGRHSSQLARKKQQTLSPMRNLQLLSDTAMPLQARSPEQKVIKSNNKSKKRKSQIKYIISSPIEKNQPEGFCATDPENKKLLGL